MKDQSRINQLKEKTIQDEQKIVDKEIENEEAICAKLRKEIAEAKDLKRTLISKRDYLLKELTRLKMIHDVSRSIH